MLPVAPRSRGHHYHLNDKQPLPPLQMTHLPSMLPSSRTFPQRLSLRQIHSTHTRYWTSQQSITVPSAAPYLPLSLTPAPSREYTDSFSVRAHWNNILTESGTHSLLVPLFLLPHIMIPDATVYEYYIKTSPFQPRAAFSPCAICQVRRK